MFSDRSSKIEGLDTSIIQTDDIKARCMAIGMIIRQQVKSNIMSKIKKKNQQIKGEIDKVILEAAKNIVSGGREQDREFL